jgi:hypothetical protein
MKICVRCGLKKLLRKFRNSSGSPDGKTNICKRCYHKLYKSLVSTPKGAAKMAWNNMRSRVKRHAKRSYSGIEVRLTEKEFFEWAIPRYKKWFKEHPGVKPSIDRLDSKGHYELSNIQMIPYRENCGKTSRSINSRLPHGFKFCGRCEKVLPYEKFKKVSPGVKGTFGLAGWCILCFKEYERIRSIKHRNQTVLSRPD